MLFCASIMSLPDGGAFPAAHLNTVRQNCTERLKTALRFDIARQKHFNYTLI